MHILINPACQFPPTSPRKTTSIPSTTKKGGRAAKMSRLEDYHVHEPAKVQLPPCGFNPNNQLWSPFKSCADFEFAEVILEAMLSKKQIEKLIKISQHCINGEDTFSLISHYKICEIWTDPSAMVSPVSVSANS
jgi:hypothetical protein